MCLILYLEEEQRLVKQIQDLFRAKFTLKHQNSLNKKHLKQYRHITTHSLVADG